MNINMKQDFTYLFSGLSGSSRQAAPNLNFLSDYMSIKNGSYGKVMKAYYQKPDQETEDSGSTKKPDLSTSLSADSARTLANVEKAADKLKDSADKLLNKGKGSLFEEKDVTVKNEDGTTATTKQVDKDGLYKAASDFVNQYNSLIDAVSKAGSGSISSSARNMTNITQMYSRSLEKAGISVGLDNKLSIDEKTFKAADVSSLKSLFQDTPSFGYTVSSQSSFISFTAGKEAEKANTYNNFGTYNNNYNMGNIFNGFF